MSLYKFRSYFITYKILIFSQVINNSVLKMSENTIKKILRLDHFSQFSKAFAYIDSHVLIFLLYVKIAAQLTLQFFHFLSLFFVVSFFLPNLIKCLKNVVFWSVREKKSYFIPLPCLYLNAYTIALYLYVENEMF